MITSLMPALCLWAAKRAVQAKLAPEEEMALQAYRDANGLQPKSSWVVAEIPESSGTEKQMVCSFFHLLSTLTQCSLLPETRNIAVAMVCMRLVCNLDYVGMHYLSLGKCTKYTRIIICDFLGSDRGNEAVHF